MKKSTVAPTRPVTTFGAVLGAVVIKCRERLELSQAEASAAMGIPRTSLSRLERGRANFTVTQLRRASGGLKIEVSQMFLEAEAGAAVLSRKGVEVLDEEPPEKERARWVWVAPREVEEVVATIKLGSMAGRDFWSTRPNKKEEKLKIQLRQP